MVSKQSSESIQFVSFDQLLILVIIILVLHAPSLHLLILFILVISVLLKLFLLLLEISNGQIVHVFAVVLNQFEENDTTEQSSKDGPFSHSLRSLFCLLNA